MVILMSQNPFSSEIKRPLIRDKVKDTKPRFSVFLCSFDLQKGIRILFTNPPDLYESVEELKIIKALPIWRISDYSVSNQLQIMDSLYATRYFPNTKNEDDMKFMIAVKGPRLEIRTVDHLLNRYIQMIDNNRTIDIKLLINREILDNSQVVKRNYKLSSNINSTISFLDRAWNTLIHDAQLISRSYRKKEEFNSSQEKVYLFHFSNDKFTLKVSQPLDNDKLVYISLLNNNKKYKDIAFRVSRIDDVFSSLIWKKRLNIWKKHQKIIVEMQKEQIKPSSLIQVRHKGKNIFMKSIEIPKNITS